MKLICKKCGSEKIQRIHRGTLTRIITFFADPFTKLRKYECPECGWRGLRKKSESKD